MTTTRTQRPIARSFAALVLATTAALATGSASAVPPAAPAAMPSAAAPSSPSWRLVSEHDFEREHPGFGTSQRYESTVGWVDVYRYGMKRKDWADGLADRMFAEQFQSTIDEVKTLTERGDYRDLQLGPTRDLRIAGVPFRSVSLQFRRDGELRESRTFMTGRNGQLLKYRMSFPAPAPAPDKLDTIARAFIEDHLRGGKR